MAYIENIKNGVTATNLCPTFTGFHRNLGLRDDGNFHAGLTLRYAILIKQQMTAKTAHELISFFKFGAKFYSRFAPNCEFKNFKQ